MSAMTPKGDNDYAGEERRTEARTTRPFGLVRYFSLASAAAFAGAIAVIATLHLWTSRENLVALAEIETLELGQTVANLAWPDISRLLEGTRGLDDDTLRSRPETRQVHDLLQRATTGLTVLKIKIYGLDGRTIFSTDTKEIGQDRSNNPGFLSAAKKLRAASKLSRKGSITAFSGIMFNRDVVETYVPVYGPSGNVEAVFELYNDVSRTVSTIYGTLNQLVFSLVTVFFLLYGLLYLIVRRADQILQQQSLDISFKSAALADKNTELEREIAERKQIEGRLEGAVQSLQEAFAFFDADDRLVYCNAEYKRMHPLGQEMARPGVKFEAIIRANVERGNVADAIGHEEEYIRDRIARHRNPKGPIVRQLTNGQSVIINETRTPDGGTCLTMTDVTEVRRAAEAVRLSEDRLRGAVAALQEGFAYYDADDRLVLLNDEYRRLHKALADILKPGMRFEELMRTAVERGTIPDAVGREEAYIRERMDWHRDPKGPILRTLADGTCYVISESRTPDGGIVVTENDVTERHRAEQALTLSESRLRGAIESLQEGFALCDAEDRVVAVNAVYQSWNPFAWEILEKGGTFEDMLRANVASGAVADAVGREEDFIRERMEQHRNPTEAIARQFSDGRWALIHETRTPEGGIAITFTDITDVKRAEEALKEGERALRAVIDAVPAMVSAKDRDFRYLFMNKYQAKLYGIAPKESVGRTAAEILGPEYGHYTEAIDAEVLATNRGRYNYEENWVDSKGATHVLLTTKVPLADDAGNPNRIVTVALDITERKQAEQAQRDSDLRLRGAIESMREGFALLDADDRVVTINDLYLTFNPHAPKIIERGGTFEDLVRANVENGAIADAIGREEEFIRERMEHHRNWKGPILRQFSDGRWYILNETKTPDGGTAITFADITDLKRTEEALRESEQRLKTIIDSVPAIINVKDTKSRYLLANRYHREMFGVREEDVLGKPVDLVSPEHAKRVRQLEQTVITSGEALPFYDDTLPDTSGKSLQFMLTKTPLRDLGGRIVGTVTTGIDVTDRRKLEETIESERRRLVDAIESIEGGAILYDADDRIVLCNSTYRQHLGAIKEILVPGTRFEDVIRAVTKAGIIDEATADPDKYVRERIARHRALKPSLIHVTKSDRWISLREYRTSDGGTLIIRTDITEQKRAEEALRANEQQLRTIMESSPIGIAVVLPAENKRLYVNPTMVKLYGAESVEQMLTTRMSDTFVNPDDFRRLQAGVGKKLIPDAVVERKRPDGSTWWCLLVRRPIVFQGQNAMMVWNWDITDRKRAEQALRASEERFKDIAEAASDWFWETGPDFRCKFVSDRFYEQTGFHLEDVIGKTLKEFVGPEIVNENPAQWQAHNETLKKHLPFHNFEYSQRDADGLRQDVRVSGKPIFDDEDTFLGYRGVATDITDYRRTERELTHHKRMESLGNLAGGIAHNLNNLLQPILILGQLTSDALEKSSVEHQNLQVINLAAVRAKELVDRILAFSRNKSYKLKSADICEIVREELNLIHSIVPSSITISENLDEDTGAVLVDALQAQTVLMNIVGNAVDAMDGMPGRLDISLARTLVGTTARNAVPTLRKGNYAKLTISDNGRGMDEKTLGRIFDPFFTTKEPGKGTGLGLSTAFGIVAKHGGTIRASSAPGKGTTFDIYLPLIGGGG
jgi:PAS domain S-box-containing protein